MTPSPRQRTSVRTRIKMHKRDVKAGDRCLLRGHRDVRFLCSFDLEGVQGTQHIFYEESTGLTVVLSSLAQVIGPLEGEQKLEGQMVLC